MTKDLAVVPQNISRLPSREEMEILQTIAKFASESKHFEKLGGVGGIFCIGMYAFEIGIPPLVALYGGMQNIVGKITIAPEMLMGLIRERGHRIDIIKTTNQICEIKGTRKDTGETYTASYSMEDAQLAGLSSKDNWKKGPSDMLYARCSGRLKRRLFPDIATRAYVEGEIEEAEVEPPAPPRQYHGNPTTVIEAIDENISTETATRLEKEIDTLITPVDNVYKQNLLSFFKAESFDKILNSKLKAIENSIAKKVASLKKTEIETVEVVK